MPLLPCGVSPERNATAVVISSPSSFRNSAASSATFALRLGVAATRRDVSTSSKSVVIETLYGPLGDALPRACGSRRRSVRRTPRRIGAMRIATFNINSIRGRLQHLLAWLAEARPDVVCLQELRIYNDEFPL